MFNYSLEQIAVVLTLAAAPITELRGAIPIAITQYHMPVPMAYGLSVLGNLIPVVVLLLLLEQATILASRIPIAKRVMDWVFAHTRRRHSQKVERWGKAALVVIVSIPLPMTGAWTGSIVAFLFGISFREAFPLIGLGVLIAGVIVTLLTLPFGP